MDRWYRYRCIDMGDIIDIYTWRGTLEGEFSCITSNSYTKLGSIAELLKVLTTCCNFDNMASSENIYDQFPQFLHILSHLHDYSFLRVILN